MENISCQTFGMNPYKNILLFICFHCVHAFVLQKIKAYSLQDKGMDTVEANEKLGFKADARDYTVGVQILADLGIKRMRLMTNNPKKIEGLEKYGIKIVERVPLIIKPNTTNIKYLKTKKEKLGHYLGE